MSAESSNALVEKRQEALASFAKKNPAVTVLAVFAALAFIAAIAEKSGVSFYIFSFFTPLNWALLGISFSLTGWIWHDKKYTLAVLPLLAWVAWISVFIRTRNLPRLRDVTTGGWTLGPDLDPFLFLRWAENIVAQGQLFVVDTMRYFPLGFNTKRELILHPYMIAWFHKVAAIFGSESVTQSAVLYPVFFFVITVIAFFFLAREIFIDSLGVKKSNIIALVSSFLLAVAPSILPRTIAGIPEKESAAFFFLFFGFFLFIKAFKAKTNKSLISFSLLTGLVTSMMALVWGGYVYLFVIISLSVFVSFVLGKINSRLYLSYSLWLFSSVILMRIFSTRYELGTLLSSTTTSIAFFTFFVLTVHHLIYNTDKLNAIKNRLSSKVPSQLNSLIIAILIALVAIIIFQGPSFVVNEANSTFNQFVKPINDRLGSTVAENRQPYFTEWAGSFGPILRNTPILFWLFFVGSIFLFYHLMTNFEKKEKIYLTIAYTFFLCAVIFSRYSSDSLFNGSNFQSILLYFLGFIVLLLVGGYYYFKHYKENQLSEFKSLDFGIILLFVFFILSLVSARGAVRLIMILVPSAAIIASYLGVELSSKAMKQRGGYKLFTGFLAFLVCISLLFSGLVFNQNVTADAAQYAPSVYTQQWQYSMDWVRTNTPENAVFAHWWDYGYWVQSIGKRATMVDGGNAIPYWNYLVGRHILTGTDERKAVELLYTHNVSYFLIDSTDIGKYSAFSLIGSDEKLDRASFIPTMFKSANSQRETKDSLLDLYQGGFGLDEDIIYSENGSQIFLPAGKAGVAGIIVSRDFEGKINHPAQLVVSYQNTQYNLPLRYAYDEEQNKFIDFGVGYEAGFFPFAVLGGGSAELAIDENGGILFLSKKVVNSNLAHMYLYKEDKQYFNLVNSQDSYVVSQIKAQNPLFDEDFAYYNSLHGPIRIWEVNYPADIEFKEEYLQKNFPESEKGRF